MPTKAWTGHWKLQKANSPRVIITRSSDRIQAEQGRTHCETPHTVHFDVPPSEKLSVCNASQEVLQVWFCQGTSDLCILCPFLGDLLCSVWLSAACQNGWWPMQRAAPWRLVQEHCSCSFGATEIEGCDLGMCEETGGKMVRFGEAVYMVPWTILDHWITLAFWEVLCLAGPLV